MARWRCAGQLPRSLRYSRKHPCCRASPGRRRRWWARTYTCATGRLSRPTIWRGRLSSMKFCAICLFTLAAAASDANWPQFRGPSANGIGAGSPPMEWNVDSGKNIRWKTAIPGLGHSSPVIWGNRIFITSAVPASGESKLKVGLYGDIAPVKGEPAQSFNVYCLDRKTGKILWERVASSGMPKIMRHPKSTHANPTPATDGKHLVVFFGSEGLFTYNLKGKLL